METVIQTSQLTKTFRGVVAVNGLDLRVGRGSVYGLIGRNGAGKTTTLRLLMGLLKPDSGEARILGTNWWEASADQRERVGYVSQTGHPPGWMSLEDLGRYSARFFTRWDSGLARELARRWMLPWNRPLERLSGGHQRLASLLLALSARPEVLVLDEPAAGLDPVSRRDLLRSLVDALLRIDGCTVLLSTHLLADVERIATHVGILDHGRIVGTGSVDDWQRTMRRVQVVYPGDSLPPDAEVPGTIRSEDLGPVLTAIARIADDAQLDPIRSLPGVRVHVFPLTLEELFIEWMGPSHAEAEPARDPDRMPRMIWDRSTDLAGVPPQHRVGVGGKSAIAPAERECDARGGGPIPFPGSGGN